MAPFSIPPAKRLPMTSSAPCSSSPIIATPSREIVASVGVPHDDVLAARRLASADQRGAVTPLGNLNDASSKGGREVLAAIRRSIVRNDNLAVKAVDFTDAAERFPRICDALRNALKLV